MKNVGKLTEMSFLVWIAALTLIFSPFGAQAASRQAIIVDNSDYNGDGKIDPARETEISERSYLDDLSAPVHDGERMADLLAKLGFMIERVSNTNDEELVAAIRKFKALATKAGADDELIFYYSGHSIQIEETLYLVPTNARPYHDPTAGRHGPAYMHRDRAVEGLVPLIEFNLPSRSSGAGYNLIILDSCRSNPWPSLAGRGIPDTRSSRPSGTSYLSAAGSGLVDRRRGTILALAAAPGTDATGWEDSSPFTDALLQVLRKGEPIDAILHAAGGRVAAITSGLQQPHTYWDPADLKCIGGCEASVLQSFSDYTRLSAELSPVVRIASRAYQAASSSWRNSLQLADGLDRSLTKEFSIHYFPVRIEGRPDKPEPATFEGTAGVALYVAFEFIAVRYAGEFETGKPHGRGVVDFECQTVMLRARCPLTKLATYVGRVDHGKLIGPGQFTDHITGRQDIGYFSSRIVEGSPIAESEPSLILGLSLFPTGGWQLGRFSDRVLIEGYDNKESKKPEDESRAE